MKKPAKAKDETDYQQTVEPGRYYSVGGKIVRGRDFAEGILPINAEEVCLNLGQRLRFGLTQLVKRLF